MSKAKAKQEKWQQLMAEAMRSKFDKFSKVSCLVCKTRFSTYASLAQHLDILHNGKNSKLARYDDTVPDQSGPSRSKFREYSLADVIALQDLSRAKKPTVANVPGGSGWASDDPISTSQSSVGKTQRPFKVAEDGNNVKKKGKVREDGQKRKQMTVMKRTLLREREKQLDCKDEESDERQAGDCSSPSHMNHDKFQVETVEDSNEDDLDETKLIQKQNSAPKAPTTTEVRHLSPYDFLEGLQADAPNKETGGRGTKNEVTSSLVSIELNKVVADLLQKLREFERRQREKNLIKAQMKPRMLLGFREAGRAVRQAQAKVLIVATNIEACSEEGGTDMVIRSVLENAAKNNIQVIWALSRRKMGAALKTRSKVSMVAVMDYSGAEDLHHEAQRLAKLQRQELLSGK